MKVSSVNVELTQEDLLSILDEVVNEYAKVENLKISSANIEDSIIIQGTYSWKINLEFKIQLGIIDVINNIVILKIEKVKFFKLGIFSSIVSLVEKKLINEFKYLGIGYKNKEIRIDLKVINKLIPMVDFEIISLRTGKGKLICETRDILINNKKKEVTVEELKENYDIVNNLEKIGEISKSKIESYEDTKVENETEEVLSEIENVETCETIEGYKNEKKTINITSKNSYNDIRDNIEKSVPNKYKKIMEYALLIPDLIVLMGRLFKDKRVPIKTKYSIGAALAYISIPIDIIPDFIPFIGKIDDVTIIFFVLEKIVTDIPKEIIVEHWQGKEDLIQIITEGVKYLTVVIGLDNTRKVMQVVKSLFKFKKKSRKEVKTYKKELKRGK
ncbi:Uncharacterized membrane protein YkvA, DUF1232 family [Clostridium collagenovorans DSM 3089]|uniref:Uncharacterized membrane protein YkvA, DUF1232 family n=1 Tax=Clostridium collagenovorans DSM 3089 TaxID=1121306 RepID=A0A1M5VW20_9CLOT|nr:DUF1232 domain-containing protein [Clostridium collagenovorans]SHH79436.1 Uncharacterized membrane protein YkvA, DUF1232 family [Clostridium collagenovorans DSM 3089]